MEKLELRFVPPEEWAREQEQERWEKIELGAMCVLLGAEVFALVQMARLAMMLSQLA